MNLKIALLSTILLTMLSNSCKNTTERELQDLLEYHLKLYPLMNAEDIYKMLYQGTMGVVHFIDSPQSAKEYLIFEFDKIEADSSIQLIEPVSTDGKMVRLNLRAYKNKGGKIQPLFDAMMKTAMEFEPSKSELEKLLKLTVNLAAKQLVPFDAK